MDAKHTILVVSEWDELPEELSLLLDECGYGVTVVDSTEQAKSLLGERSFDLVILGRPVGYQDDVESLVSVTLAELRGAATRTPALAVLTHEPYLSKNARVPASATVISLYDFEIGRFLESIRQAIGGS